MTGDGLKLRDIQNAAGISDFAPNVSFGFGGGSGSGAQANLFVRGVGQNDFSLVTDPGVGLYVDGVYYARVIGSAVDLVDVARIEVLRGPQGTLFGRNTIGGAISITTTDPSDEFGGDIRVIVGGDERIETYGSLNVPLTEDFGVIVSGLVRSQEGTVIDASGRELGDDNVRGGRIKAVWTPIEKLRLTISSDYVQEDEGGLAEVTLARSADGSVDGGNTDYFRATSSAAQGPNTNSLDNFGLALTADYNLTETLAIKSVTAYRDIDGEFNRNPASISNFSSEDVYRQSQISQELQLLGDYDFASFVVGGFVFLEDGFNTAIIDIPPSPAPFPREVGVTDISNRSVALFAEATVPVTDHLRIIAGVRYTDERKEASFTSASVPGRSPGTIVGDPVTEAIGFSNPQSLDFSEVNYRGIVQYDFTDSLN
ncbi:MAG: TonB-dependent receptor, partial [Lacipirellulaceae bacterium]